MEEEKIKQFYSWILAGIIVIGIILLGIYFGMTATSNYQDSKLENTSELNDTIIEDFNISIVDSNVSENINLTQPEINFSE